MIRLLLALLLLVSAPRAVDTLSIPTNYLTVTTGTRATLAGNFTSIETWGNKVRDSIAQVTARLGGYTGNLAVTSLSNLRLKLDGDNSETARLLVESGNGDSLFTVREDSTAKFYGNLTVNGTTTFTGAITGATGTGSVVMSASPTGTGTWALPIVTHSGRATFSDSIIGASQRMSGNILANAITAAAATVSNTQSEITITSTTAANPAFLRLTANGALGYIGKEGTSGTDFMTGGTAGAIQLVTATNVPVQIGVNGAKVANFAASATSLTGTLDVSGNITGDSLISSKFYTEGTFTISLLGCTTTPTGTARYVRVGKQVTLFIPALSTCTSNQTYLVLDGAPNAIAAARNQDFWIQNVYNNGTAYDGLISTQSGTPMQFALSFATAPPAYTSTFTGSGAKGFGGNITITYTLQ